MSTSFYSYGPSAYLCTRLLFDNTKAVRRDRQISVKGGRQILTQMVKLYAKGGDSSAKRM